MAGAIESAAREKGKGDTESRDPQKLPCESNVRRQARVHHERHDQKHEGPREQLELPEEHDHEGRHSFPSWISCTQSETSVFNAFRRVGPSRSASLFSAS